MVAVIAHQQTDIELPLEELALNLTNDPSPISFGANPLKFEQEKIRIASIGGLSGILSQSIVGNTSSAKIYYYLNDHLGAPQLMTDEEGEVAWRIDYRPFGEADADPNSTVVNKFRFPGQYFDQETGLHYNYHRYYDPQTGRYLTPDPIGLIVGINLFAYARNNPINVTDPIGLWALIECERCLGSGEMFCTIMEDGLVTGSFTANAWTNYPSENPIDPYGRYGPLPPGKYDLPNAYSPEFERRLPNPTNTGTPSVVRTPDGTTRTGIRVHRGRISKGCITLGPGAQGQQLENELTNLVDRHLSKGGTIMTIGEVDCCED